LWSHTPYILRNLAIETAVNIRPLSGDVKNRSVSEVVLAANEGQNRLIGLIPENPPTDTITFASQGHRG
jgi:hypothetical protein